MRGGGLHGTEASWRGKDHKIKKTWFVLTQEASAFPVLVEIVIKRLRKSTCLIEAGREDEDFDILIFRAASYLRNESGVNPPCHLLVFRSQVESPMSKWWDLAKSSGFFFFWSLVFPWNLFVTICRSLKVFFWLLLLVSAALLCWNGKTWCRRWSGTWTRTPVLSFAVLHPVPLDRKCIILKSGMFSF